MDWKKEMTLAMLSIQSACMKNDSWYECRNCPFDEYCTLLQDNGFGEPTEWEIETED
jgi:hypothetical protein